MLRRSASREGVGVRVRMMCELRKRDKRRSASRKRESREGVRVEKECE